jgi:hypothetical protein
MKLFKRTYPGEVSSYYCLRYSWWVKIFSTFCAAWNSLRIFFRGSRGLRFWKQEFFDKYFPEFEFFGEIYICSLLVDSVLLWPDIKKHIVGQYDILARPVSMWYLTTELSPEFKKTFYTIQTAGNLYAHCLCDTNCWIALDNKFPRVTNTDVYHHCVCIILFWTMSFVTRN